MVLSVATTASRSFPGTPQAALSASGRQAVARLRALDQSVRAHEQAHISASGGLQIGGPSFSYVQGPDGVRYAVGGEVAIQAPVGKTPDETIQLSAQVRRAALAPVDPSAQDRAVAAAAAQRMAEAQVELMKQRAEAQSGADAGLWSRALEAYRQAQDAPQNPGEVLSAVA